MPEVGRIGGTVATGDCEVAAGTTNDSAGCGIANGGGDSTIAVADPRSIPLSSRASRRLSSKVNSPIANTSPIGISSQVGNPLRGSSTCGRRSTAAAASASERSAGCGAAPEPLFSVHDSRAGRRLGPEIEANHSGPAGRRGARRCAQRRAGR